jgi:hypothetical protein
MRTTIAASPPRLHWQAAFTTKTYKPQTSSLVVWQHVFVSDTPMTNWGGSSLLLTRVVKNSLSRKMLSGTDVLHNKPSRSQGGSRNRPYAPSPHETLLAAELRDSTDSPTVQLPQAATRPEVSRAFER